MLVQNTRGPDGPRATRHKTGSRQCIQVDGASLLRTVQPDLANMNDRLALRLSSRGINYAGDWQKNLKPVLKHKAVQAFEHSLR